MADLRDDTDANQVVTYVFQGADVNGVITIDRHLEADCLKEQSY